MSGQKLIFVSLALSLGLAVAACAAAPKTQATPATPAVPLADSGAVSASSDGDVTDTAMETPKALVERVCQSCHDLGVLTATPHAAADWPVIVQRMRSNGADLTDEDAKKVQAYLAETYSATP